MNLLAAHRTRLAGHELAREVVRAVLQARGVHRLCCLVGDLLCGGRGLGRLNPFLLKLGDCRLGRPQRLQGLRALLVSRQGSVQRRPRGELGKRGVALFQR